MLVTTSFGIPYVAATSLSSGQGTNLSDAAINKASSVTRAATLPLKFVDTGSGSAVSIRPSITIPKAPSVATEVPSKRTQYSRTVANPDGSFTLQEGQTRLNYRDASGNWQPIDVTLVPTAAALAQQSTASPAPSTSPSSTPTATPTSTPGATASPEATPSQSPSASTAPTDGSTTSGSSAGSSPTPSASPSSGASSTPVASSTPSAAPSSSPTATASLSPITASTWDVTEKANDKQVQISEKNASNALAQLSVGPYTLTLRVPGANRASKNATSSGIDFAGSTANDSFAIVPTPEGLEFSATLANANAPTTYQLAINTHGLVASLDPDGLTVDLTNPSATDPTALVGTISAPTLQEATGGAVDPSEITVSLDPKASSLRQGETMLTYAINPAWLHDAARSFPVVLDPTACMAYGYSNCQNWTTGTTDTFVMNGSSYAGKHQVGWTVDRVGSSAKGDGYGVMRTLLWWNLPQIPDGNVITAATVQVAQYWNGGTAGEKIHATLNTSGFNMSTDWANKPSVNSTYQTASLSACGSRNCWLDFDATTLARAWYGHAGNATNFGVTLALDTETQGELQLENYTSSTDYYHPQLEITYMPSGYKMAFDSALGPDFAPSTIVAGGSMTLPISVTNIAADASGNWHNCTGTGSTPADCWSLGYRWYAPNGAAANSGKMSIPAAVTFGQPTALMNLSVPAPTGGVGQYTLRLDMVHTLNGIDLWSSDWAYQSTYYARAKVSSSPSNVHWGGTSPSETNTRSAWSVPCHREEPHSRLACRTAARLRLTSGRRTSHTAGPPGLALPTLARRLA